MVRSLFCKLLIILTCCAIGPYLAGMTVKQYSSHFCFCRYTGMPSVLRIRSPLECETGNISRRNEKDELDKLGVRKTEGS